MHIDWHAAMISKYTFVVECCNDNIAVKNQIRPFTWKLIDELIISIDEGYNTYLCLTWPNAGWIIYHNGSSGFFFCAKKRNKKYTKIWIVWKVSIDEHAHAKLTQYSLTHTMGNLSYVVRKLNWLILLNGIRILRPTFL